VCPVLVVRAAGPSFEIPKSLVSASQVSTRLGFSNMASYFSVKMESEIGSTKESVEEMSSYARCVSCILERGGLSSSLIGVYSTRSPIDSMFDPSSSLRGTHGSFILIAVALKLPRLSISTNIPRPSFDSWLGYRRQMKPC
jgi:hypothetical protein